MKELLKDALNVIQTLFTKMAAKRAKAAAIRVAAEKKLYEGVTERIKALTTDYVIIDKRWHQMVQHVQWNFILEELINAGYKPNKELGRYTGKFDSIVFERTNNTNKIVEELEHYHAFNKLNVKKIRELEDKWKQGLFYICHKEGITYDL